MFTALEKKKQGPALVLSLDEDTQDSVLELEQDKIGSETGVAEILKVLDRL